MGLIDFEVFVGHDDELARESMAESVLGRAALAGFGFGSSGVLGVSPVNFDSIWSRHAQLSHRGRAEQREWKWEVVEKGGVIRGEFIGTSRHNPVVILACSPELSFS